MNSYTPPLYLGSKNEQTMNTVTQKNLSEDLFASSLRSQINILMNVLNHIETGNPINDYVAENLRTVEKDIRWLRKISFNT